MIVRDPIDLLAEREKRLIRAHQKDGYVTLRPLLDELGIVIEEKNLPEHISGEAFFAEGRSPSGFVIVVNKNHSTTRKRFTAAHEIGHCLLHSDEVKRKSIDNLLDIFERREEPTYDSLFGTVIYDPLVDERVVTAEREADRFAAALLMPATSVLKAKRAGVWRYRDLAKAFGVSEAAVKRRVKELFPRRSRQPRREAA